jgi:hypothetical protein
LTKERRRPPFILTHLDTISLSINTKKRYGVIVFASVWVVISFIILLNKKIDGLATFILITIDAFLACYIVWLCAGRVVVTIYTDALTVTKKIGNTMITSRKYSYIHIGELWKRNNEKANTYWSLGSVRLGGFSYTPEFLRLYDINPVVVYFEYKGRTIKLGEGLEEFNAELIVKEIKRRRKVMPEANFT